MCIRLLRNAMMRGIWNVSVAALISVASLSPLRAADLLTKA
jgi:hypothetical protein